MRTSYIELSGTVTVTHATAAAVESVVELKIVYCKENKSYAEVRPGRSHVRLRLPARLRGSVGLLRGSDQAWGVLSVCLSGRRGIGRATRPVGGLQNRDSFASLDTAEVLLTAEAASDQVAAGTGTQEEDAML